MTASIQVKNNRYHIVLSWSDSSGKRKQKWVSTKLSSTGHNKRKAEQMRMQILREWEEQRVATVERILFSDYLKAWLEDVKYSISKNTYFSYLQTVQNSICPYFAERGIMLCDLKPAHIQDFYRYKIEHDKVSANTIHHYHANIHKALSYAVQQERISANPADGVTLPKKQKHIAEYYTTEELKVLLSGCKGTKIESVVYLAAWFGMRRGEIIGLRWDCIDFVQNTLSVRGTIKDKGLSGSKLRNMYYEPVAKTDSSLRTFIMPAQAADYLKRIKSEQDSRKISNASYNHQWDDFVCVQHNGDILPLEYVSRTFPVLCQKCGLRRLKLHELRHTNISLLLNDGASMKELQEWAGHSSYSTTANIYSHINSQSKEKLAKSIEALLN